MKLEILSLCKSYKKRSVLENISFEAESGEIIGIVGGNGCGKSTMLSILAGVSSPDSGSFNVNGVDLFKNKKNLSSVIGYVPQNPVLFEELSGKDNLYLWYDKKTLETALSQDGLLSMLEIKPFMDKTVSKMSGGMKKRISIACAVSAKPEILLLDEPSSALDLPCKEKLYGWYKKYTAGGGTIIVATHDTRELELCTKVFVLKNNRLSPYNYTGNINELAGYFEQDGN